MTRSTPEPTLHDVVKIVTSVHGRLDTLDERMENVAYRISKVETAVLDLHEDVSSALKAIDADAVTLIDHERRLSRLKNPR